MTTATISPWPLVREGDQEHPVQTLQYLLRARGRTLTVDGIFGPGTGAAVCAFQQQKGLAVDGIVGPATWPALIITVRQGSQGAGTASRLSTAVDESERTDEQEPQEVLPCPHRRPTSRHRRRWGPT
jgi:peptidoglycan hydrolase-like protein with peptidoglycan-binding domain